MSRFKLQKLLQNEMTKQQNMFWGFGGKKTTTENNKKLLERP
jgi:hypothetical protein